MPDDPLTYYQTIIGIIEFIEVAIHTILYVRQVYPADLFVRRKKYDTPVYQSRHPVLNEYISGAMRAVGDEIISGTIDKVILVIKDKDEVALERFIFSIEKILNIEGYNTDVGVESAMSPTTLGQYFRSFLIKLSMIEAQLGQLELGDNTSFAIILECKEGKVPGASEEKNDPPPWIPANIEHTTAASPELSEVHLVRAVDTGIVNLSLVVQESGEKLRRMQPEPEYLPVGEGKEGT
ncbi:DNA-binding protein, partial [Punctularia strigosozonata HHB-11173 SS5]|uniref:DNA-binding protein n=1 Tax=Punctularia strigosozonata (strain HHB-11173) TaxID=741275 RepID=UPI000441730B